MIKPLLILLSAFFLVSCSGTYNAYYDSLKFAFGGQSQAEFTLQQVREADYDLLYVKSGERAQAVMVLAYLENGLHKWVSQDQAMLVLDKGRIVKTLGFDNDLLYLTNTVEDPLKRPVRLQDGRKWLRLADWKLDEYGYQLRSEFRNSGTEVLTFYDKPISSVLLIETVTYLDKPDFIRGGKQWHNYFWFDAKTGTLLKSRQQLAPFWHEIEITHVSHIVRLLENQS